MWYNLDTSNRKSGSGDVTSIPLPDTRKGKFLMQLHFTFPKQSAQKDEEWRELPGSEGRYEVSNYGRVRSYRYRKQWHTEPLYLKNFVSNIGYLFHRLRIGGVDKNYSVHRLVMLAFVGPSELEVNHKDGNKTNNHISNLEYVTHRENARHARHVLGKWIGQTRDKVETDRDREIRALAATGISQHEIARRYDVSQPYVSYIVRGLVRPSAQEE